MRGYLPATLWRMRVRGRTLLLVLPACLGLISCGAALPTGNGSSGPSDSPSGPTAQVSIPADGIALTAFGYTNGPVAQLSLPRTSTLVSKVDQPNNVVAVLSRPAPGEVADYLRRALPATGFTIDQDDRATVTMTFDGYGWTGSFTANADTSAVLLRPS
jgi:hypothetical protein